MLQASPPKNWAQVVGVHALPVAFVESYIRSGAGLLLSNAVVFTLATGRMVGDSDKGSQDALLQETSPHRPDTYMLAVASCEYQPI